MTILPTNNRETVNTMEDTLVPLMADPSAHKTSCCGGKRTEAPTNSNVHDTAIIISQKLNSKPKKKNLFRSKSANYEVKHTENSFYSNGDITTANPALSEPLAMTETQHNASSSFRQKLLSTSTDLFLKPKIGVVGTGNFAVAFTKSLVVAGYDVIMGSRRPHLRRSALRMRDDCFCGVELTSVAKCLEAADVVVVAIHMEDFQATLGHHADHVAGKVVVDPSNREYRYATRSNAEQLAAILPRASVVKAFNSVPAQAFEALTSGGRDNLKVLVAGDSPAARHVVAEMAKALGLLVVDVGRLAAARHMEEMVMKTFTRWRVPIALTFGLFNMWLLFCIYLYYIDTTAYAWEQIFLKVVNKPLCMTAMTVLALTYLPGQLAAVLQVYRGTKHREFPRLLDNWLKCRKQLGLIAYTLAAGHVLASVLMMSPTYYRSWYHQAEVTLPANMTGHVDHVVTGGHVLPVSAAWMNWKGEAACLAGLIAFVLMSVVAVTSIPSVGEALNWSEWRCIHSTLSYAMLGVAVLHVVIMGSPSWAKAGVKIWKSITFLSFLLPACVLLLKIAFSLPPLYGYLRKIRRGWERPGCELHVAPSVVNNCSNKHETTLNMNGGGTKGGCQCSSGNCGGCNSTKKSVHFTNSSCGCSIDNKTSKF